MLIFEINLGNNRYVSIDRDIYVNVYFYKYKKII